MHYRKVNGTWLPYSAAQLRRDNPRSLFPKRITDEFLAERGIHKLVVAQKPAFNPKTQALVPQSVAEVDGKPTRGWSVQDLPAEEIEQRVRSEIDAGVQSRLDAFARSRGYDSMLGACSYASSDHATYGPEGRCCVGLRDQTWDAVFAIWADVEAGARSMPQGYTDIEPELPALAWPE